MEPDIVSIPNSIDFSSLENKVEFRNVWFAYNEEEYVLKDITLEIKKSQKIALVGATGSGKTSIINLLACFVSF